MTTGSSFAATVTPRAVISAIVAKGVSAKVASPHFVVVRRFAGVRFTGLGFAGSDAGA